MDILMSVSLDKSKFLETMSRSLSRSFNGSLNKSLTQPGFLEAYYNFQLANASPHNRMAVTPSRELAQLEDKFCKDFNCCGLQLNDMHELLQHFEECHVVLESDEMDEDEDDLQFQFEGVQDTEMEVEVQTPFSDMYLGSRKRIQSNQSVALADIYQTELAGKKQPPMSNPWQVTDGSQTFPPAIPEIEPPSDDASPVKTPTIKTIKKADSTDDEGKIVKGKEDRPYKCKIAGCNKSYKNPGGLKYHLHHGHCEDTGDPEMNNIIHKPYQCTVEECGKRYKNLNGLKYHIEHAHQNVLGK